MSSSSSSSYAAFIVNPNSVEEFGQFEIISQLGNSLLINTGRAYDGYGNMLFMSERRLIYVDFTGYFSTDVVGKYGYLCIRRKQTPEVFDYLDHPVTGIPTQKKTIFDVEFYLTTGAVTIVDGRGFFLYYPPLDTNKVICGIMLGKVYESGVGVPDVLIRSPLLATKDGTGFSLQGFNII
jgi:hypothetical protein